jgi:hypothetical protein
MRRNMASDKLELEGSHTDTAFQVSIFAAKCADNLKLEKQSNTIAIISDTGSKFKFPAVIAWAGARGDPLGFSDLTKSVTFDSIAHAHAINHCDGACGGA